MIFMHLPEPLHSLVTIRCKHQVLQVEIHHYRATDGLIRRDGNGAVLEQGSPEKVDTESRRLNSGIRIESRITVPPDCVMEVFAEINLLGMP